MEEEEEAKCRDKEMKQVRVLCNAEMPYETSFTRSTHTIMLTVVHHEMPSMSSSDPPWQGCTGERGTMASGAKHSAQSVYKREYCDQLIFAVHLLPHVKYQAAVLLELALLSAWQPL